MQLVDVEALDFMVAYWCLNIFVHLLFFCVGFSFLLLHHVSQELSMCYLECVFLRVDVNILQVHESEGFL